MDKGSVGGWFCSIDSINIPIKKWVPSGARMSGQMRLPISDDKLKYSCLLTNGKDGVGFQFVVKPQPDYKVDMWAANLHLSPNSSITVEKPSGQSVKVAANLNANMDITVSKRPSISFTALTIQGLQVGNYNPKNNQSGFYFDPGAIKFGIMDKDSKGTGFNYENPYFQTPGYYSDDISIAHSGPNPEDMIPTGNTPPLPGSEAPQGNSIAGFKFLIGEFTPINQDENGKKKIGFKFDVGLSLGRAPFQITGATNLGIYGLMDVSKPVITPPKDYGLDINKVTLGGDFGPLSLNGELIFRDENSDQKWGNGIAGNFKVKFPMGISASSDIVFGSTNYQSGSEYDYWGIGASVYSSSPAIAPIGPLSINGFGGGFYNNLTLTSAYSGGTTAKKLEWQPKKGAMTFKALLNLSLIDATILKTNPTLAITLNTQTGGVELVRINGEANIISDGMESSKGLVNATIDMSYVNNSVEEAFDFYLDYQTDFLTSKADIPVWAHVGKMKGAKDYSYYLYLGHPGDSKVPEYRRIKSVLMDFHAGVGVANVTAKMESTAYLCAGNILPKFPPLPSQVTDVLKNGNKEGTNNSVISQIASHQNKGFMFEAAVNGSFDAKLAIFYANATVIAGFDVALLNMSNSSCAGPGFGLHNWYATGQFYAYLGMSVGFDVDLWFYSGRVSLASLSLGAALQAGLPNPTWLDGNVRIKGKVLGGMIKINTGCQITIGEVKNCTAPVDPLEGVEMISEIGPTDDGGGGVDVMSNPYVAFSMPMSNGRGNNPFEVPVEVPKIVNGKEVMTTEGTPVRLIRTFKFEVVDQSLATYKSANKNGKLTTQSNLKTSFSSDGYTMTLYSSDMLSPQQNYGIYVKCQALEKVNGAWVNPEEHKNGFTQDSLAFFKTGKAPEIIKENMVVNSYPMNGQNFLLKNEFDGKGKIQLYKSNPNYFTFDNKVTEYNVILVPMGNPGTSSGGKILLLQKMLAWFRPISA